jgi:hypothetical protein
MPILKKSKEDDHEIFHNEFKKLIKKHNITDYALTIMSSNEKLFATMNYSISSFTLMILSLGKLIKNESNGDYLLILTLQMLRQAMIDYEIDRINENFLKEGEQNEKLDTINDFIKIINF